MTAKEYLGQLRTLRAGIRAAEKRLAELKEMATAMGTRELKQDVVQSSIKNKGMADAVVNYLDYERAIEVQRKEYLDLKDEIVKKILKLDGRYAQLLLLRYGEDMRFEQIAEEMGYTYDWTRHMHGEALQAFENAAEKEEA